MSSVLADLEASLQAMLLLKPPGVSGSKIQSITALCTANVQSESVLIQKLYTHLMRAPATHKLGVLYVVDAVTRKWTEQAKAAGQNLNSPPEDGTFAAGVNRVKELLKPLMNHIIPSAPNDQKEKIRKLVDIWEKGQTFPQPMLNEFKEKLAEPSQIESTTPPGSPSADLQRYFGLQQNPAAASSTPSASVSILEALANMARQNTAPANQSFQPKDNLYNVSNTQNSSALQAPALNQSVPFPPSLPPVNLQAAAAANFQGSNIGAQNYASNQTYPLAAVQPVVPPVGMDPSIQQMILVKALIDQGVPQDKIPGIIAMVGAGGIPVPPQFSAQNQNPVQNPNQIVQNAHNANQNGWGSSRPDDSRDRNGYQDREAVRSPQGRFRERSRSRSPARGWNSHDSPGSHRRDDSGYDRDSPGRNRGDDRGRGRGSRGIEYRQRSPPRRGQSTTPPGSRGNKWIGYDTSIGAGNIKVLSRTLFVGGVNTSDQALRNVFEQYGRVQTCIVNKDKRHAFVKMISRTDALAAKDAMEKNRAPDSPLRTRWGVGFGPRDCSDYQTGISVIPISKLTDADEKWMLSAEYGGSGGKPIEQFMVVEEPDIEIGQGVSSKAISRRMQTDKGGNNGPKSSRDREEDEGRQFRRGGGREDRRHDRRNDRKERQAVVNGPPSMPSVPPFSMAGGFPYGMPTLANGMPMVPPGFTFPGQTQTQPPQPPAPGHRN